MASRQSQFRTVKHDRITAWVARRHGVPARVRSTTDAIRIKIGNDDPRCEPISWEQWFEIFDGNNLAFVYEDPGYSSKVVARNGKEDTPVASPPENAH